MVKSTTEIETELLKAIAKDADQAAFEDLYGRIKRPAFSLALHITRHPVRAEDAVQESMIRVWKHAHSFRVDEKPRSWILRIVARESLRILNMERKSSARQRKTEELLRPLMNSEAAPSEHEELLEAVNSRLRHLPESTRQILALRFGANYSQEEIGLALKIPQRTVSNRLKTALESLRSQLTQAGLASATSLDFATLGEAILQSFEAPETLQEKVLSNLPQTNDALQVSAGTSSKLVIIGLALTVSGALAFATFSAPDSDRRPENQDSTASQNPSLAEDNNDAPTRLHKIWTFAEPAPDADFRFALGGWKHVPPVKGKRKGNSNTQGHMKLTTGQTIIRLSINPVLPIKISIRAKTLPPTPELMYSATCGFSEKFMKRHAVFKNTHRIFTTKGDKVVTYTHYYSKYFSDSWANQQRVEVLYREQKQTNTFALIFRGRYEIHRIEIEEIEEKDMPDLSIYKEAINRIPPAQRVGSVKIPQIPSVHPTEMVRLDFYPTKP